MKITLLFLAIGLCQCASAAEVYVHMMPWFETPATNNGQWGIHWTMANRNPDNWINGVQDIASWYHPVKNAYASSDPNIIDWQLSTMKAAGIAGVFIDWPGTNNYADYDKNKQNAEAIIAGTERNGLKFAIVYEDNNLNLAGVGDKIGQGTRDMEYLQNNYFWKSNYVRVNGNPLLLDFGPQALTEGWQWDSIFQPLNPKPTYLTLWYQSYQGGSSCQGEFAWIWTDFIDGLRNWYANVHTAVRVGVAYPGFNTFYDAGGWGGPGWSLPYGVDTFRQTLQLAVSNTNIVQVATWNDYGEGTIIEPTVEYGWQFLDIIQQTLNVPYTHDDFMEASEIYDLRVLHAHNATMLESLRKRHHALIHKFD